jgi:nicotinate-nucleotide adenylyltransferase
VEQNEPKLLHAITGVFVAQKLCDVQDAEILSAIRYHTTGKANMSPVEKVIYLADFIEEAELLRDVNELRQVIYQDVELGLLKAWIFSF